MVFALLLLASADWTPARWNSTDPKSLELLAGGPINCLLIEESNWSDTFARAAAEHRVSPLAVIRPAQPALEAARRLKSAGAAGIVLEGVFEPETAAHIREATALPVIEIVPRRLLRFGSAGPVLATHQGVWPGIQVEEEGAAKAAPSGGPWINTNSGFLRFARAASERDLWIANTPPSGQVIPVERYAQAIADAAMTGARWVLALDPAFERALLSHDQAAVRNWKRITAHVAFYEQNSEWRRLSSPAQLALVQNSETGGLVSGGILDMIAVKHTPVRAIPVPRLDDEHMRGARMAVNVDPSALTPEQAETLRRFTRSGGTLLTGPPGWKFPALKGDDITLAKEDVEKLDAIWKELNSMTGRRNLGARLFNVSSMLSNLLATPDGKRVVLHLVNYSDYPAQDITVHVLGKFTKARMLAPEQPAADLAPYSIDEGTAIEIPKIATVAAILLE